MRLFLRELNSSMSWTEMVLSRVRVWRRWKSWSMALTRKRDKTKISDCERKRYWPGKWRLRVMHLAKIWVIEMEFEIRRFPKIRNLLLLNFVRKKLIHFRNFGFFDQ